MGECGPTRTHEIGWRLGIQYGLPIHVPGSIESAKRMRGVPMRDHLGLLDGFIKRRVSKNLFRRLIAADKVSS